ncbi:hypothetical protein M409DRAFT_18879 [Zasmidium cellare ATCC 36951]|uniref:Uncharacterized protein n=1 Tax=Zasmidium cellare ATCC 36951 TaxID=1080233 RepID=A0A6A6CZV2_ZASCE|nr:uncharacterized protein M409DRAFT_18879 [Zasmidium cellare ATCC 36951]KAF2170906.1 hypothetical protein M409DRAFT_18879 [Zasmidium cellare ATCC 36951]
MSNPTRHSQPLYGIEARSDWLVYIVNTLHAIARQRLLEAEQRRFYENPSTTAEQRLFHAHAHGEVQQIQECIGEVLGSLHDIVLIGEDYVRNVNGPVRRVPLPESIEGRRHMPFLTVEVQTSLLNMLLDAPRDEEFARLGLCAQHGPPGSEEFASEHLAHLVNVHRDRNARSRASQAQPTHRRRHSANSARGEASEATNADVDIENDEDVDYNAIWDHIGDLAKAHPEGNMTTEQRETRAIAQKAELVLMQLNELVRDADLGDGDHTDKINDMGRVLFESYPLEFRLELGKFFDDLSKNVQRTRKGEEAGEGSVPVKHEEAPEEGVAGSSTGPGTLSGIKQEHDASTTPQRASVEEVGEGSPDPATIPLPDSDSAYGSASSTTSEHRA